MPRPSESIEIRVRAAKLLDLPGEATPAEARAAFLARLDHVEFTPSDDLRAGLGLLDERVATASFASTAVENARRDMLRSDVEEFGRDFWILLPDERKARWQALWERFAKQPALIKHMEHLARGLDVAGSDSFSLVNHGSRVADLIKSTFLMWRLERIARRQQWLAETSDQPVMWKQAALQIRSAAPGIAALDPELINELITRVDRAAAIGRTTGTRAASHPIDFTVRSKSKTRNSEKNRLGWAGYLWIAVVISSLVRAFSTHPDKSPDPAPPPYQYQYQYQDRTTTYTVPLLKRKEETDAEKMKRLLKQAQDLGLTPPPPAKKVELLPLPRSVPPAGDRP